MDEMRCERKIMMVLKDVKVDEYIHQDISEIDLYNEDSWKEEDAGMKDTIR